MATAIPLSCQRGITCELIFFFVDKIPGSVSRRLKVAPFLLVEISLVVEHPQVKVPFHFSGELAHDPAFADHLDDRHVNGVIPVGNRFFFGDISFLVQTHELAMNRDMFEHAAESIGYGEFDVGSRAQLVQNGRLEKFNLLVKNFQILRL
jgi:hypothetical protein